MNDYDEDVCPLVAENGNPCCLRTGHYTPCCDAETIQARAEEFFALMQKHNIKPIVVDGLPNGEIANPRTVDPNTEPNELREALGLKPWPLTSEDR